MNKSGDPAEAISEAMWRRSDPGSTRGRVDTLLREKFSAFQPLWVEQHLRLLCSLRQTFGNDLDKPIILGVIGQRMLQIGLASPIDYDQARTGDYDMDQSKLTNVESISEATGIPRESVRRKVSELLEIGWVERGSKGRLSVTPQATSSLDEATHIIIQILGVMFDALARDLSIALQDPAHPEPMQDGASSLPQPDTHPRSAR